MTPWKLPRGFSASTIIYGTNQKLIKAHKSGRPLYKKWKWAHFIVFSLTHSFKFSSNLWYIFGPIFDTFLEWSDSLCWFSLPHDLLLKWIFTRAYRHGQSISYPCFQYPWVFLRWYLNKKDRQLWTKYQAECNIIFVCSEDWRNENGQNIATARMERIPYNISSFDQHICAAFYPVLRSRPITWGSRHG